MCFCLEANQLVAMADPRVQWMKDIVVEGLGALPKAFDYMMSESSNRAVIMDLLENKNQTQPHPAIIFYTSQMDTTLARLVHGSTAGMTHMVAAFLEGVPEGASRPSKAQVVSQIKAFASFGRSPSRIQVTPGYKPHGPGMMLPARYQCDTTPGMIY